MVSVVIRALIAVLIVLFLAAVVIVYPHQSWDFFISALKAIASVLMMILNFFINLLR